MSRTSGAHASAVTPTEHLHQHRRNISSRKLTSPMPSPSLSALGTSLAHVAALDLEGLESARYESTVDDNSRIHTVTADSPPPFDCFSTQNHPRGHFYSAFELCSRGVWIGYFAPERYNESFQKLPSFSDLKTNFRQFSAPFPPAITGAVREERKAICRGCVGDNSAVITLREVQFVHNTKLVVMPLDGDDEAGMFCIMLSQPNDRSLHGLQSYRPYEYLNGGKGATFENSFMLLTLRNTSRDIGTLDTVRAVLSADELEVMTRRTSKRPRVDSRHSSAPIDSFGITKPSLLISTKDRSGINDNAYIKEIRGNQITEALPTHNPPTQEDSAVDRVHVSISQTRDTFSNAKEPLQTAPAVTKSTQIISLDLTDEQARRVYIVWMVNDDGLDYEFVHTMDECKSFDGLLGLLQEDTEAIPSIAKRLSETKMWRLTYQLTAQTRKAFVTRKETEIAFDRLQAALAHSTMWMDSCAKIDIELTALGRNLSSAPAI